MKRQRRKKTHHIKFDPIRYLKDVDDLPLDAIGAYSKFLSIAHFSAKRGTVRGSLSEFAGFWQVSSVKALKILSALEIRTLDVFWDQFKPDVRHVYAQRCHENDNQVTVTCPRMKKEFESHKKRLLRQKRYRDRQRRDGFSSFEYGCFPNKTFRQRKIQGDPVDYWIKKAKNIFRKHHFFDYPHRISADEKFGIYCLIMNPGFDMSLDLFEDFSREINLVILLNYYKMDSFVEYIQSKFLSKLNCH